MLPLFVSEFLMQKIMQAHMHFAANVPDALRGRETSPFALRLPISKNWNTSAKRLLLVYEFVDTEDLKAGTLLVGPQGNLLPHLLQLAEDYSSEKTPALAAINFDYFRNRHLSGSEARIAENAAVARVREYIAKVKPTDVFVFGQNAARLLLEIDDEFYLRGRVRKIKGIYWNHTVNISTAYQSAQDDVETDAKIDLANLIGFTSRCLGNTLKRTTVHHIQFDKESARYSLVDTMEKWEKFFAFWSNKSIFSLDLETSGLGRVVNEILTMQIAFSAQRGFIVPISHKDSPFTKAEIKRVYADVRKILSRKIPSGTLDHFILGQNLKFDMTVLRQQLQIQVVHWPLWDCFSPETFVVTPNGKKKVKYVNIGDKVLSFNHAKNVTEWKSVQSTVHKPSKKRMLRIKYEGGSLEVTEDHKLWVVNRNEYVEAQFITTEDVVLLHSVPDS